MRSMNILLLVISIIFVIFLDYINLPTHLGLHIANINWTLINITVIILLYIITYNILDRKSAEKENNKGKISKLLIKECYELCLEMDKSLSEEIVNKFIVPKVDFNIPSTDDPLSQRLENLPFANENIILELIKDGQLTEEHIAGYFNVKKAYQRYISIRITLYDSPNNYMVYKNKLYDLFNEELSKLDS
ncbi:hypothetical protein [Listeria fleischmannii]|uniref:Uncharacterized protein n=1 Tax=Listeria fleischmannii TaxID=1069827 RepID=A0A841YHP3_9LIST|nr:hypothetical protein [Listeria fleischmannii]EIA19339.1 hypothetical protein KKC_12915 [Listeria fleischmannii subsp. coloradonensis]MBC1399809.1 hypothetical protein [Listeria fleischmannii]MBC1428118.1 hypothetical protein [Listeria fleischmannii]STY34995.1 Uncharacterised protein [Listeria fleischmannii subsp. coloradonensis]